MSGAMQRKVPTAPIMPGWVLAVGAGAVGLAILAAAIGGSPTILPPASVNVARTLSFDDAPDGAVIVTDVTTHAEVARLAPGADNFIRGTLRGLAHGGSHERNPLANHPFVLTAWSDGRLTLDDPVLHRRLDLEAFGSLNSGAFAKLLTTEERK
jgi:putative photosynthetic complex assembly protein